MKKSFILFAALAALFSCTKETPVSPETPSQETYSVTLTAVAPTTSDDTKTTLVEGGKFVHWSKGDAIKVMFAPQLYYLGSSLMNGSDGYNSNGQILNSYFTDDTASEAQFRIEKFTFEEDRKEFYNRAGIALYPSTATATSNKVQDRTTININVFYHLPNEQVAVAGNIESNLNFSYADVDLYDFTSGSVPVLQFKNACSLIKLTMPQSFNDKNVVSVTIESNDASYLSGKGIVDFAKFPGEFKVDVAGDSNNPGVTLVNETGFEAGASYYAVVWPGEHSGLTFTFTAEDGATATVTTSKAVNLQASHVKPYTFKSALQFEEGESWVYYAPGEGTGKYYYDNGTVGDNPAPTDRKILGVVFYNGNPRDGKDTALPAYCTHGLAISLNTTSTLWGSFAGGKFASYYNLPSIVTDYNQYGYTVMDSWNQVKLDYASDYAGIKLFPLLYDESKYPSLPSGTSGWYYGTAKEWEIIASNKSTVDESLATCGASSIPSLCWLPILASRTTAYSLTISGNTIKTGGDYAQKFSQPTSVRPIFAF